MEKYIKRYFWTINLVTIALCAYLAARWVLRYRGCDRDRPSQAEWDGIEHRVCISKQIESGRSVDHGG